MNIPNFITLFRVLLIPLLVIFLVEGKADLAFITFIVASTGDALDGFLARLLRQQTVLGRYIDPIADKLLVTASCVTMAAMDQFPAWLAVIIVSRDILIMGGIGVLMLNDFIVEVKPTFSSKITTFVQFVTISFFLGHQYLADYWFLGNHLARLAALFTLLTGVQYILIGLNILKQKQE